MWIRFKALTLGRFRRASLKRKVTILIFSTVAIVLVFCSVVFGFAIRYNSRNATRQLLYSSYLQKRDTLADYMERLDHTAYTIMFSNWAQRFLANDPTASPLEIQIYHSNITHFLNSLATTNDDMIFMLLSADTMLYSNTNSQYYDLSYAIEEQPWFPQLLEEKKYVEYGASELFSRPFDDWTMTVYYPVTSYYDFSVIGYLAVNVPADNFSFLIGSAVNETVTVADPSGRIFLSRQSPGSEDAAASRSVITYSGSLLEGDWNIRLSQRSSLHPMAGSYLWFFLLLIPILLMFILVDIWFSHYLTKPIMDCKNAMLEIRNNHFGVTVENRYQDEISELIDGLNEMSGALVTLLRQNEKMDNLRREAEFEMLQQKVNPHFLYNTLEIINSMILGGQGGQAVLVCETLGKIYHYNLSNSKWVTLREEYGYIQGYLQIIRHKMDDLTILGEVDEQALDTKILKLILQPLVENSIKHGFRGKRADCCLTLSIRSLPESVEILIMDNGAGIPPERLAQIEETLRRVRGGDPAADSAHIGIRNIYQRLLLEYGSRFTFSLESRYQYGTKATLTISLLPGEGAS